MITFRQLEAGGEGPPDIEVLTDDANAELAAMNDAFIGAEATEMVAASNLDAAKVEDGWLSFVIPGNEAGEVGEIFEGVEGVPFSDYLEELNAKAIAAMEEGQE